MQHPRLARRHQSCAVWLQHFDSNLGEYPEGHPKPPFNCTAIGARDEPVGQPKWRLRPDHSLEILDPRFQPLAAGGWRNEVRGAAGPTRDGPPWPGCVQLCGLL